MDTGENIKKNKKTKKKTTHMEVNIMMWTLMCYDVPLLFPQCWHAVWIDTLGRL